jgi:hypothetical protein
MWSRLLVFPVLAALGASSPCHRPVAEPATAETAVPQSSDVAPAPGQRATVTVILEGKRNVGGSEIAWHVEGGYTSLEHTSNGQRRHVVENFSGWSGDVPEHLTDGPGFLAPFLSPIALADDRSFQRLEDPPTVRAEIDKMLQSSGYASKSDPAVLANVLSDAGLDAIAMEVWATQQTFVRDLGLDVGDERQVVSRAPVPQLGGSFLDLASVVRRDQDQPCPGTGSGTCAAFAMQTSPDPDRVREIIEALPVEGGMPRIDAFDSQTHIALLCDARSHAPYRFRFERRSEVRLAGGISAAEQSSRTYVYDYRAR